MLCMGKVKLLLDVIDDMRSLANSLEAVADAMGNSDAVAQVPEQIPIPEVQEVVTEEPAPTAHAMSKEELREFLGNKSVAGHRDTVHALIHKYGGKKFSDIDPKHYPALQKEAEALPDAT